MRTYPQTVSLTDGNRVAVTTFHPLYGFPDKITVSFGVVTGATGTVQIDKKMYNNATLVSLDAGAGEDIIPLTSGASSQPGFELTDEFPEAIGLTLATTTSCEAYVLCGYSR